jgi:hypothetical protein
MSMGINKRDCSESGKTGKIERRENLKEADPCVYEFCYPK